MHKTYSIIPCCCLGTNITDQSMKLLWIELYALANFSDTKDLKRGQLRTTYTELSNRSGLTEKQVRTRIDRLVSDHLLEKKTTNKGIILTIVDYDKQINGKGRHLGIKTSEESVGYRKAKSTMGRPMADEKADVTCCNIESSGQYIQSNGKQNGRQNVALYNSVKEEKDAVVEESSINISLNDVIRQKQIAFKEAVLAAIEQIGWKTNMKIPEFKDAVVKFLEYFGSVNEDMLSYETVNGFNIECRLRRWIRNEYSLKSLNI